MHYIKKTEMNVHGWNTSTRNMELSKKSNSKTSITSYNDSISWWLLNKGMPSDAFGAKCGDQFLQLRSSTSLHLFSKVGSAHCSSLRIDHYGGDELHLKNYNADVYLWSTRSFGSNHPFRKREDEGLVGDRASRLLLRILKPC